MPVLILPIPVTQPVNPVLATTFKSHDLSDATIRELCRLSIYYLADAVSPGALLWLSKSARKEVCDLLEKFGWPKFHLDRRDEPETRELLFLHLPSVVLQQNSLLVPVNRALADLTDRYGDQIFGPPTPLALALLPRIAMTDALQQNLDAVLERCGLHQQVTLDEVFVYQPPPTLTNLQIMQLTLDVMDMRLDVPTYDWVKNHTSEFVPQAFDALLAMLAVNDAPWQLRKWFNHHNLPVHPISSIELERIIRRAHIRE